MESTRHRLIEIANTVFTLSFGIGGFAYHLHKVEHTGKTNHRIYGSFSVKQTVPNNTLDINFFALTLQQFIDWMSVKHEGVHVMPKSFVFGRQRVPYDNFNINVGRSEVVYFLFDNRFSFNTPKEITVSIYEEWDELTNSKVDVISTIPPTDRGLSNEVIRIISQAKSTLMIMTPYIDMTVLDQILSKVHSNVDVKIVTRTRKEIEGKDKKATFDHIRKELGKNHRVNEFIHSRIIIRDEEEALVSSADLTHDSLISQFNAGILSTDRHVIEKLVNFFNLVLQKSRFADST